MKKNIYLTTWLCALLLLTFFSLQTTSCKKQNDKKTDQKQQGEDTTGVETLTGTWTCKGSDLPTRQQIGNDNHVLVLNADSTFKYSLNYTYTSISEFSGTYETSQTTDLHTNGKPIHNIVLNYNMAGTDSVSGAFQGICVFEWPKKLIVNIERSGKYNHSQWPTSSGGIGSGHEGEHAVYIYRK